MSVILYSRESWDVCKCGHYKWQHSDFVYGGEDGYDIIPRAEGHGKCGHGATSWPSRQDDEPCDCQQFTWVETIPHRRNYLGSPPNQRPAPTAKKEVI